MNRILVPMIAVAVLGLGMPSAHADTDGAKLFNSKCKMCHAIDRKKVGPAVKAMSTDAGVLRNTIINGRKMMPRFGKRLDAAQVDALVSYIREQQGDQADK